MTTRRPAAHLAVPPAASLPSPASPSRRTFVAGMASLAAAAPLAGSLRAEDAAKAGDGKDAKRILVVVGPSSHPPGTHEVAATGRLVKSLILRAEGVGAFEAMISAGWPQDEAVRKTASSIVFLGDIFPPARAADPKKATAEVGEMMDRGCGIVCVHYATGLGAKDVPEDGSHPLLSWMGGYFATGCKHHKSIARIFPQATIAPATGGHPVTRGWKEFTLREEPYILNWFGPQFAEKGLAEGVFPIATSMLPPGAPQAEIVAWGVQRPDGGRGVGVVMPHFFQSWTNDDLRTLVLNAIVWSAGRDVPEGGVQSTLAPLAEYQPVSVEPAPPKPKVDLAPTAKPAEKTSEKTY